MAEYLKPLPQLTDLNRPFWDGCKERVLRLQKCSDCGYLRYPIRFICPQCLSEKSEWTPVSGRGTVMARLVFHQVYHQAFKDDVPYNVVLVQLDEGPRMFSNIVGTPNEAIEVGMRVTVAFDPATPEVTIPRFRAS